MTKPNLIHGLLLATLALGAIPMAQAQNLLVNTNFATGDFSGWSVTETGTLGNPKDFGVTSGFDGGVKVPKTGDTFGAYFNPNGGTMELSQTVDLPAAGTYLITCAVEPVFNDVDVFTIYLNGAAVYATNFEFGSPYTPISITVPASAGSQVLDFEFTPGSGPMFFEDAGLFPLSVSAPTPTPCNVLGSASAGTVIGLNGAWVDSIFSQINGDAYVSKNGLLDNDFFSQINGNVFTSTNREYFGRGKLTGSVTVSSADLAQINADALNANTNLAALAPTQVFGNIRRPLVVTGNGGVNVIDIHGNITASVALHGTSNDVFFVNVSGSAFLDAREGLLVSGGVTPGAVLYNFTGNGEISTDFRTEVDGTILAPGYSMDLSGEINGAVIGGSNRRSINLFGAQINAPDCP